MSLISAVKAIVRRNRLPYGENPVSTAARAILDRANNNVPLVRGLFASTASVTHGNSTTETSIVGAGKGSLVLPAGFFVPGKTIRVRASGVYSTKASTVGNLVLILKAGATALTTATVASLESSESGRRFIIDAEVTCRTAGSGGTLQASGSFRYATAANTLFEEVFAETATTDFDTNASHTLDLTADWATQDSSNTLTCSLVNFIAIPAE